MSIFVLVSKKFYGYDTVDCFVIAAETEDEARSIAASRCGDEGREVWLNDKKSTCDNVEDIKENGIICRSFNAG